MGMGFPSSRADRQDIFKGLEDNHKVLKVVDV